MPAYSPAGFCAQCTRGTYGQCQAANGDCFQYFPGTQVCPAHTVACVDGNSIADTGATLAKLFGDPIGVDRTILDRTPIEAHSCARCCNDTEGPCQSADGRCSGLSSSGDCASHSVLCAGLAGAIDERSGDWVKNGFGSVQATLHIADISLEGWTGDRLTSLTRLLSQVWLVTPAAVQVLSIRPGVLIQPQKAAGSVDGTFVAVVVWVAPSSSDIAWHRTVAGIRHQISVTAATRLLSQALRATMGFEGGIVEAPTAVEADVDPTAIAEWGNLVQRAAGAGSGSSEAGAQPGSAAGREDADQDTSGAAQTSSNTSSMFSPGSIITVAVVALVSVSVGLCVGMIIVRRRRGYSDSDEWAYSPRTQGRGMTAL